MNFGRLVVRLSPYLTENTIPSDWKESKTVLLLKKGDKKSSSLLAPRLCSAN